MHRQQLDYIIGIANEHLAALAIECIEAEWSPGDRVLRLFVDSATGMDMERCAQAGRRLNEVEELDREIRGEYTLEVSSPGVERPLRQRSHFERFIGETVQVKLAEKFSNRLNAKGKLLAVTNAESETLVTLETEQGEWSFPLGSMKSASLVFDWERI